jgi:hypothetical protein
MTASGSGEADVGEEQGCDFGWDLVDRGEVGKDGLDPADVALPRANVGLNGVGRLGVDRVGEEVVRKPSQDGQRGWGSEAKRGAYEAGQNRRVCTAQRPERTPDAVSEVKVGSEALVG